MVAIFDGLQRPRKGRQELDLPVGTLVGNRANQDRDRKIDQLESAIAKIREEARSALLHSPECPLGRDAVAAFLTDPKQRSDEQKKLVRTQSAALDAAVALEMSRAQRETLSAWRPVSRNCGGPRRIFRGATSFTSPRRILRRLTC